MCVFIITPILFCSAVWFQVDSWRFAIRWAVSSEWNSDHSSDSGSAFHRSTATSEKSYTSVIPQNRK
jgi:hypothetical protein